MFDDYSKPWQEIWPECCSKTGGRLLAKTDTIIASKIIAYQIAQTHQDSDYTFDRLVYKGSKVAVTVTCPEHGDWEATPNNLISKKAGCPKCAKQYSPTLQEFQALSSARFNNKFLVKEYVALKKPAVLVCPEHGEFTVSTAQRHLSSVTGCRLCGVNKRGTESKSSIAGILDRCMDSHGDEYDYSLVPSSYVNFSSPVTIICKEHGEFYPRVTNFITGKTGCPKCYGTTKRTLEEFISEASNIHHNKYTYSNATYVNNITKVSITCPEHGDFEQTPKTHLRGHGCPKCSVYSEPDTVYLLKYEGLGYKIGITSDLPRRLVELSRHSPVEVSVVTETDCANARAIEFMLLNKYNNKPLLDSRKFDGYTELRILTEMGVAEICLFLETI
jgi:hypothetical protein